MPRLSINRLGHQGDGIADGPVYVPRTLPGEVVNGELDGRILRDVRIEFPSDHRVSAPCPHYKSCGGCALQHAAEGFVADWKVDVVRQALAAQGLEAEFRPILTSPPRSRRRATFAARRTKKGASVGFHARASEVIADIPDCHLLRPEVLAARAAVAELAIAGASRKAELSVLVTATEAGLDLVASGGKPLDGPLRIALAALAERHNLARLTWDGEGVVTRNPPVVRFGSSVVELPAGAFLQATAEGEAALIQVVGDVLVGARRVVDLFAGCGTFSLPLAERSEVHAVEGDRAMTEALAKSWRYTTGLKRISTEVRDLFRNPLIGADLSGFDAAVIDPPRAGAEAQTDALARARIPRIAFVSCNPVTFARDAALLVQAGYRLNWVQVVDQFRWSAHTELVGCFGLSHMAGNKK